ncbi:MAG: ABC transporter permease, partial [Actinomyces sp.]|nr:ABC transporter permease [Actinomyces sp.]
MTIPVAALHAGVRRGIIELRQGLALVVNYVFFPTLAVLVMYFLRGLRVSGNDLSLGTYAVPGIIAMNVLFTSLMGVASALLTEREDGTLMRMRIVPHGTVGYLIGKVLSQAALTLVTFFVVMALIVLLFDDLAPSPETLLRLLWVLPLGTAAMLPLGVAVGAFVRHPRQLSLLSLLLMGMTVVSGVFYPIALQGDMVRITGQCLPLYWLGLGMRSALLPPSAAALEVGGSWRTTQTAVVLAAWAIMATVLALVALRRMTHRTGGTRRRPRRLRPTGPRR